MTRPSSELTPYRSNRHFYGSEMRRFRLEAGMSLDMLASSIPHSRSQLHRVERGEMLPPPGLSEALDKLFDTGGYFVRLYELTRQVRELHPEQYRRRMELEAQALVIEQYAGLIVPGLLQTEAYARALFRSGNPKASEEEIEVMLEARKSRQELLHSACPPDLCLILDEAVIRRPVGGAAVMRGQFAALLKAADTPTSVVQLLPFEHGEHGLMGGTLTLMQLDGTSVAYEESITTGTLLEDPKDVRARQRAYDLLRSHALTPSETAAHIRSVMEALPT